MLWVPMVVMLAVTLTALTMTIVQKTTGIVAGTSANMAGDGLQLFFAVALFALGIISGCAGCEKTAGSGAGQSQN